MDARTAVALAAASAFACNGSPAAISNVQVLANSTNPLSAVVSFAARGGDCARVTQIGPDDPVASTPCEPLRPGWSQITILGLLPATGYQARLELLANGATVDSQPLAFSTDVLPADLADTHLEVTGVQPDGYLLTAVGSHAVAFDGAGRIRWLRSLGDGVVETKQQPNGDFTSYLGPSTGFNGIDGRFLQYSPAGELKRTWGTGAPLFTDSHELQLSFDSSGEVTFAHFFTYRLIGGVGDSEPAQVAIHSLVRQSPDGAVQTIFASAAEPDNVIEGPGLFALPDLDHPNSIDFDLDGNYVVSFRNLGQIAKIDARTGARLWRLGGRQSDFSFVGDPEGGFSAQHSARVLDDGHLLIYDNGWRHSPPETRAVEYALDLEAKTATMVWQYRSGIFTPYMGSVQRLASGETLLGLSSGEAVRVDAQGNETFRAQLMVAGAPMWFYRMLRVPSLYAYQRP